MLSRLILSIVVITTASHALCTTLPCSSASVSVTDNDWIVQPDPPSNDQDLTITYDGDDPDVTEGVYYTDSGEAVEVDLSDTPTFKISASKLRGKRYLKLIARGGGESGYRIIRF